MCFVRKSELFTDLKWMYTCVFLIGVAAFWMNYFCQINTCVYTYDVCLSFIGWSILFLSFFHFEESCRFLE